MLKKFKIHKERTVIYCLEVEANTIDEARLMAEEVSDAKYEQFPNYWENRFDLDYEIEAPEAKVKV